jgi:hypothetical protein
VPAREALALNEVDLMSQLRQTRSKHTASGPCSDDADFSHSVEIVPY